MGWTNSDNKFGPTSFVVGPNIGDGVNYVFIQQAIADAVALTGPVDIYIRPGVYTENLTLPGNIYLIGTSLSGDVGPPANNDIHVRIDGDHSVSGNSLTFCRGIFFNSTSSSFIVEDSGGGVAYLSCENCTILSGGINFTLGGITGNGRIKLFNCDVEAVGRNIVIPTGSLGGFYDLLDTTIQSTGDGCVNVDTGVSQGIVRDCTLEGVGASPFTFDLNSAGASLDVQNTYMQSPSVACITFQAAATVTAFHNTYNTNGSGEYITGPGNYSYGDDIVITGSGASAGIDIATVQTKHGWRPWAETGIYPSTAAFRGGAAFDESWFTAIDGQITLEGNIGHPPIYRLDGDTGSAEPLPVNITIAGRSGCTTEASGSTVEIYAIKYTSIIASGAAVPDFGHWITTSVTTTLPAAPLEGTVVSFIITGAATVQTIDAPGTALIRIGSSVSSAGGTATSTARGDHLRLVYRQAPDDTWYAEQVIGSWTLA